MNDFNNTYIKKMLNDKVCKKVSIMLDCMEGYENKAVFLKKGQGR